MAAKDETSSEVRACQQSSELRMEKCLFGKQEIELPELLMEDVSILEDGFCHKAYASYCPEVYKYQS